MSGEAFALHGYAQDVAALAVDVQLAIKARNDARKALKRAIRDYGYEPHEPWGLGADEDIDRCFEFKERCTKELTVLRRRLRVAVTKYYKFHVKVTGEWP